MECSLLISCTLLTLSVGALGTSGAGANNGTSWYRGCYNFTVLDGWEPIFQASNFIEPAVCSKYCLQESFDLTVLLSGTDCFCANETEIFRTLSNNNSTILSNDTLLNTSQSKNGNLTARGNISSSTGCMSRCFGFVCLLYGDGESKMAVYQTAGPYIRNLSLTLIADQVQTRKPFMLEVCGYLASPIENAIGTGTLNAADISYVLVKIHWDSTDHSILNATVISNGFFSSSPIWIYTEPGSYLITVLADNQISREEKNISVEVLDPAPTALEVKLVQMTEQIPSCIPFDVDETSPLEKVFLGIDYSFEAFVAMGIDLKFFWYFSDDNSTHSSHSLQNCSEYQQLDCLLDTMNHTFQHEGVYQVTVNVSNIYDWIQKTIYVAVVRETLSSLTFQSKSGHNVAVGENLTLEMELFTTIRQLLAFDITFEPGTTHRHTLSDHSPAFESHSHLQLMEDYGLQNCTLHIQIFHTYSLVGGFNISIGLYYGLGVVNATLAELIQVYDPINKIDSLLWDKIVPSRTNLTFRVASEVNKKGSQCVWTIQKGNNTLGVRRTADWYLQHLFETVGIYVLKVTASNPISNASFSTRVEVQDAIEGLSLSSSSPRYLPTDSTITVRAHVLSGTNITYMWTFASNSTHVHTNTPLMMYKYSQPGVYLVSVTARNNLSEVTGTAIEFTVQDLVGDIITSIPNIITVNQTVIISTCVTSGTDLTVEVLMNDSTVFNTSSYVADSSLDLPFTFNQIGELQLLLQVTNLVSSHNVSVTALVVKEIHVVSIEIQHQPIVGEDVILIAKVNEYLWKNRAYIYKWTLYDNQTVKTGSPVITYRCRKAGLQRVSLSVSNLASETSSELVLNVSELGSGPRLTHLANKAAEQAVTFTFKNISSDMGEVVIHFGDGNMTNISTFSYNSFSINHTYSFAGIYNIDAFFSKSAATLSSTIVIQDFIGNLSLTGPNDLSLATSPLQPSVAKWSAKLASGSNYIFLWLYSDGTVNHTIVGPNQLIMAINSTGLISVEVVAENEVSHARASIITVAQYPVMSVTLTVARVALNKASNIMLKIKPKQDYIIAIDYGDGTNDLFKSQDLHSQTGCLDAPFHCSNFVFLHTYAAVGQYHLNATISNNVSTVASAAIAVVEEPITGLQLILNSPRVIKFKDYINATASVQTGTEVTFQWIISIPHSNAFTLTQENNLISTINYQAHAGGNYYVKVIVSSPLYSSPFNRLLPYLVKVRTPIMGLQALFPFNINSAKLLLQPDGSYATQILGFSVHAFAEEVKFLFDFGDGSPLLIVSRIQSSFDGTFATGRHKFIKEGVFYITVSTFNEFYNVTNELGAYFVQMVPEGLVLTMNSSVIHKNEVILFSAMLTKGTDVTYSWNMGDQTSYVDEGPVIKHKFLSAGIYNITVNARNKVGMVSTYVTVAVLYRMQPVSISTNKTIYATYSDILFTAITAEDDPLQFVWYFGDTPPVKTTSRSITTRYSTPGRYNVIVNASNQISSFTSNIYPVELQQKVEPNRLRMDNKDLTSVLLNSSVAVEVRINYGTNLSYLWSFGDGTVRIGNRREYHSYDREGEFTVEVVIFNNVSSASLSGQLFVISQNCQPPPVKSYGPSKIEVRRYQSFKLGVTFESEFVCNISRGIQYSWSFFEPDGSLVTLSQVDVNKPFILIPGYLLDYGIYLAIARVQIAGSVVYNNYTISVEVLATPPVSVISGGTQLFITKKHESIISLNGSESYDPDYPDTANLRFSWSCETVSGLNVPCFKPDVSDPMNTTSSTISVSMSTLKTDIDQFLFKLTVNNNNRNSSEAQLFITVKKEDNLRLVKLFCVECLNNSVNWNDAFSVKAVCEECSETLNLSYSWKLYLVNSTETEHVEVPFCKLVVDNLQSSIYGPVVSHAPPAPVVTSSIQTLMTTATTSTSTQRAQSTATRISKGTLSAWIGPSGQNNSVVISPTTLSTPPVTPVNTSTVSITTTTATTTTTTTTTRDPFPFPIPEEQISGGRPRTRLPRAAKSANASFTNASDVSETLNATSSQNFSSISERLQISAMPVTASSSIKDSSMESNGSQPDRSKSGVIEWGGSFSGGGSSSSGTISGLPVVPATVSNSAYVNISGSVFGEGSSNTTENSTDSSEYDTHYNTVEGTSGSGGRPGFQGGGSSGSSIGTGTGTDTSGGSSFGLETGGGDDVLPDIQPPPASRPSPMIEWTKVAINDVKFETYTTTGIKSQTLTFKPFSLQSKKIYMIEVIVGGQSQSGKAQLFLFTNEAPQGMTCEVRPSIGLEIQTHYSMFCTSGRKDLHYEYSYSIGNSTETVLYDGRDHEYYFILPAGEAANGYKLKINTVITDLFGSKTKPCSVTPIVSPSIKTDEELYTQGLQNLSTLILLGNQKETKNYILLLARVLHRLHKERGSTRDLQKQTRNALIKALCSLTISNQRELMETVSALHDLVNVTNEVTSESALIVTRTVKEMIKLFKESGEFRMHEELVKKIVYVVTDVMGVTDNSTVTSKNLLSEGLKATTELLLKFVLINNHSQFYVNTNLMEFQTTQNHGFQNTVQSTHSAKFYLPDLLDKQIAAKTGARSSCIISHLISFKQNPYPWGTSPVEINGDVADLTLYNCTNRRKVEVSGLKTPVLIEFGRKDRIQEEFSVYLLLRTQMNVHTLPVTPANLQQALQIRVNFTRPHQQVFPIMLLVRSNKEPTPSKYNLKQIHYWDGDTIHLFIPAASLLGVRTYYLGLLDANYDRRPKNNYLAKNVSYTLNIQWIQCLYWDDIREWKSDGCSPQQESDSQKINCSCNHMTTFTVAHQQVAMKDVTFTDILTFISAFENYVTCITVLFALTLYILLVILCKRMDFYIETKPGLVVLQDNAPTDQHLYEIAVETGFRTKAGTTAKVHIKLHGEDGVSETRELYHSEKQLFERNSRHTFIMSVPESLGSIWKIHLWHNNGGHSPSWYVTSVIVKDLLSGTCWFFPAECWLAVDEGDGKVERELISLAHGPGFKKLLYSKLTEYLEDFHVWGSVYSRPSYSSFTHTQRLTVCLCLLLGYMCLNTVLTNLKDEEYTAELGLIDVSTASLITGLITNVVVLPVVLLVSLLFRFSKVKLLRETPVEGQYGTIRGSNVYSVEAHRDALLASDSAFESYLSWQNLQQWAQEAWRKKYERGLLESQAPSIHSEHYSETSNKKGRKCLSEDSSSGFEDCSSQENAKPVPKDCKHSSTDLRSDYSSEHSSLFEQSVVNGARHFLPTWCYYLAWVICLLIALVCILITSLLGLRFGPTKSILWIHSLFFSLLYCIFVIQPIAIFCTAAVVALKNKDCNDFYISLADSNSSSEACKQWNSEPGFLSESCPIDTHYNPYNAPVDLDRIVAARQRARYLRLARPPTSAQLKEAKDRMRKENLIQQTLQEFVLYIVMLILLLLITFGKVSKDEYYLNQAIRMEFTRNEKSPFINVKTADDWWNWSFSALLHGLYWDTWYNNAAAKSQAGPVHGKCHLIGAPSLRKIQVTNNSACNIPEVLSGLIQDCGPPHTTMIHHPDHSNSTKHARTEQSSQCGRFNCYRGRGSIINLGRTRHEAYATLLTLKESEWIDRNTRAVIVEFTLYNPPTNLFTTVSLLAELLPLGGVLPSAHIESVSIYQKNSLLDYFIMAFELLFLALILLHLYFQVCRMTQRGILSYWQEPWNWLEIGLVVMSLFYYIYYVYYFVLAVDVIDHLHSGYFKAFVDMSFISAWIQMKRFLHGLIVFLLLIKSIRLLRVNKLMAPCVTMLRLSYSSLMLPVLCGIIVIVAYSCLGNLLFLSESYSFCTAVRAFQSVLMYFMGVSEMRTLSTLYKLNQLSIAVYYGTFFIVMTILWAGMFIGILTSMAEEAKKSSRSKHLVTFTEVAVYAREKIMIFTGRNRNRETDHDSTQGNYFYLDEFENLMDELLFRLNALSNSLHHSLPAKPHYLEDSPYGLGPGYYYNQGSENRTFHENCLEHKVYKLEQELFRNNQQIYELLIQGREHNSDSDITDIKTLRSKLELETLYQLQICQENMDGTSESAQRGHKSSHSPKSVKTDSCTPQNDFSFPNDHVLKIVSCRTSDPPETFCNSISQSYSISTHNDSPQSVDALNAEHYNLAKLGDTLPHVLCGIKCPEKQAAQTRMLESRVTGQQRCSSASTFGKNRKQLKRSHTTVIQILDNPKELAVETFKISQQAPFDPSTQCLGSPVVQLSSRQHSPDKTQQEEMPEKQVGSEIKPVKVPEKLESSILSSEGNGEQNESVDVPDLPGSIKQCW
ncbi:polycystin-1-like protein 1 isoform X2 [Heptranchias perlo]|uniref:polycystin-1-like protein 1 isoform X2 n=1 Tax=Heptranchias perlo TaxID=212740 RepID=UPI00355A3B64